MSAITLFIWIALFAIVAGVIYWHLKENQAVIEKSKKEMTAEQSAWLSRFAWSRSIQLFFALGCSVMVIMFYSLALDEANTTIATLAISANTTPIPAAVAEVQPIPEPVAEPVVLETTNEPTIAPQEPVEAPNAAQATLDQMYSETTAIAPEAKTAATETKQVGVDDVFKPGESNSDGQSAMDTLKQRYEDMLVTYFFLDKCGLAEKNDYYIIMAALSQDMASVNAPGRMQYDILTAARGSYDEVYSQSPCDSVDTQNLHNQYKDYIDVLAKYGRN